jgi:hypothetical protein
MKSQRYLLQELEQVQEELKAIGIRERILDPTKYKELSKKEMKLLKQLSKS